jgi:DNA-binding MarR family transcriptional regulator
MPTDADPAPVDAVVQLAYAVHEVLGALAARHDLSLTQLRLLAILRDREPAMLDLARHLGLGKSSVSGLIDRAAERGLVERTPGAQDGRAVHVRLTPAGRALAGAAEAEAEARLGELLAPLGARDQERLGLLAATVVDARRRA